MTYEGGGYYGERDLTPGEFRMGKKDIEVKTDSLLSCGQSLMDITTQGFAVSAGAPLGFVKSDYGKEAGSRAIGNDRDFSEMWYLANWVSGEYGYAQKMEKVNQDLVFGNLALANVAMGMAMKYGATDGFNAANLAGSIDDAFAPPANAQGGTLADMYRRQNDARLEGNRRANLPQVDPSDVKFYYMSGLKEGEDFVIADTGTSGFSDAPPESDGDFTNGETVEQPEVEGGDNGGNNGGSDSNPYFRFAEEDDYNPNREQFEPPENPHAPVTLAPGADYGTGSSSSSSGTMA